MDVTQRQKYIAGDAGGRAESMQEEIGAGLDRLRDLPIKELRAKYCEVFGAPPKTTNKYHLVRRIAWQLQVAVAGDLPERALARAAEIADDGVLDGARQAVPKRKRKRFDWRLPAPGTELSRVYRDRRILVQVVAGGFEYEGQRYRSLSAVARQVTGTRWNGLVFFGLAKRGETLRGKRPKRAGKDRRRA